MGKEGDLASVANLSTMNLHPAIVSICSLCGLLVSSAHVNGDSCGAKKLDAFMIDGYAAKSELVAPIM